MKKNIILSLLIAGLILIGLSFLLNKEDEKVGFYTNQLDTYVVEKTVKSSELSTSSPLTLTQPATGNFYIENIIVSTDATGLATGTDFAISITGNDYGLGTVFSSDVAGLGANKTIDLNTASTTKQRAVLEDGSYFTAICTTANCEGSGKAKITFILKKAEQGSAIFD